MRRGQFVLILAAASVLAACSSHGTVPAPVPAIRTPQSISPGAIKPAPMARTAVLPRSAMRSPSSRTGDVQGLNWTQMPGTATQIIPAPDGSLWALSDQPSGPDKNIWHYTSGAWQNVSGQASQLAVAPNGTLYAINSGGGTYAYNGTGWSALGGGARNIAVSCDNSVYVVSNGGSGPDYGIWHFSGGAWQQVPGAGVAVDVAAGASSPCGFYVINSHGSVYSANANGVYSQLPGEACALAADTAGVYALSYPANPGGNSIYYYDLNAPGWALESGAGKSIATDGSTLYVIGASGAIYYSSIAPSGVPTYQPSPAASPNVSYPNVPVSLSWRSMGPYGDYDQTASGKLNAFAIDPTNSQTMYVGGGWGTGDVIHLATGVYKTTNGGQTWAAANAGLSDGNINDLWIDRNNPGTLLVLTERDGIFRSTDGAATWSQVYSSQHARQILQAGSVLYAATGNGLAVSNDDGVTWSIVFNPGVPVNSIAAGGGTIYVGTSTGVFYGVTPTTWQWRQLANFNKMVHWIAVDPATPSTMFVIEGDFASTGYVQMSTDGGSTWRTPPTMPDRASASVIAYDPTVAHELYYVGGDGSLYYTKNNGTNWTDVQGAGDERSLHIIAGSPEKIFIGSDQGFYQCVYPAGGNGSGALTCTSITYNISDNIVYSLSVRGNVMLTSMQDIYTHSSTDGGATWHYVGSNGYEDDDVLVNPVNPQYCYIYGAFGFSYSNDGCKSVTWNGSVPNPSGFTSYSGGMKSIAISRQHPNTVYISSATGILKSTDYGVTFASAGWPFSSVDGLAVDPGNDHHIIVVVDNGPIEVTFDGGSTWTPVNGVNGWAVVFAFDPLDGRIVFSVDYWGDLYRSLDGGLTWTMMPGPVTVLPENRIKPLTYRPMVNTVDPFTPIAVQLAFDTKGNPPYLVMGTYSGIYLSTDFGAHWQDVTYNSVTRMFNGVQWDDGYLYSASNGNGVLRSTAPIQ